jgi:hypothetical protein
MVHLDIKKELTSSKWKVLPPSSKLQPQPKWEIKHAMCVWLKTLEVTSGFPSNLRSLVSMKDLTLTNYNSYDCHIMLTTFLPIAIKATKSVFLKMATMWSCYFFNEISQKVIDHDELELRYDGTPRCSLGASNRDTGSHVFAWNVNSWAFHVNSEWLCIKLCSLEGVHDSPPITVGSWLQST